MGTWAGPQYHLYLVVTVDLLIFVVKLMRWRSSSPSACAATVVAATASNMGLGGGGGDLWWCL